jgi:hypothetical protein
MRGPFQNERQNTYIYTFAIHKSFFTLHTSGPTGSNDTGLMSLSCPGLESIAAHTHRIRIL